MTSDEMKTRLLSSPCQDQGVPSASGTDDSQGFSEPPAIARSDEQDDDVNEFVDNPADEDLEGVADEKDEEEHEEEREEISETAALWGAAGAGCGVGYVLGGVVLAVVGAAGIAYAATKEGKLGDAARSSGRAVVAAGRKAKDFNEKHKVTEKAKRACVAAFNSAKEANEKHKITERTGKALKGGYDQAKGFNEKHEITTKVAAAAVAGAQKVKKVIVKKEDSAAANISTAAIDSAVVPHGVPTDAAEVEMSNCMPDGQTPTKSFV